MGGSGKNQTSLRSDLIEHTVGERIIEVINRMAKRSNMSANRLVEVTFFEIGKASGDLPEDAEMLGETRGGARERKPKDSSEA